MLIHADENPVMEFTLLAQHRSHYPFCRHLEGPEIESRWRRKITVSRLREHLNHDGANFFRTRGT